MLELARYNIEVHGLTQRIELAHVDAKRLPFDNQRFDVTPVQLQIADKVRIELAKSAIVGYQGQESLADSQ